MICMIIQLLKRVELNRQDDSFACLKSKSHLSENEKIFLSYRRRRSTMTKPATVGWKWSRQGKKRMNSVDTISSRENETETERN